MKEDKRRLSTLGVRPTGPALFWDFDKTEIGRIEQWARLYLEQYDIYESSKGRYHLVGPLSTFDAVQELLYQLHEDFPTEQYIMNCRRLRLRVSAKWDADGQEASPAPVLIKCECYGEHIDKRVGVLEVYYTKW